jgi:hypothetical protein
MSSLANRITLISDRVQELEWGALWASINRAFTIT